MLVTDETLLLIIVHVDGWESGNWKWLLNTPLIVWSQSIGVPTFVDPTFPGKDVKSKCLMICQKRLAISIRLPNLLELK